MPPEVTRRTFVQLASAAAIAIGQSDIGGTQNSWSLSANVVTVPTGFALRVTYSIDFDDDVPLYVQVADSVSPTLFFSWERILEPAAADLLELGAFGIPYDRSYDVSVVLGTGQRHSLSPVVQVQVPSRPGILG